MGKLASKKVWLERYIGQDLSGPQCELLERFAGDEFLLVFDRSDRALRLTRVTYKRRTMGRSEAASLAAVRVNAIRSRQRRGEKPQPVTPAPTKPASQGLILGDAEALQVLLQPVTDTLWQLSVAQFGGSAVDIGTPTDLADAKARCLTWVAQRKRHQEDQIRFASIELELLQMLSHPDRLAVVEEEQRLARASRWLRCAKDITAGLRSTFQKQRDSRQHAS